jgi:hypothetical protein
MVQMLDRLFWHHWISFIWWAEGAKILPFFVRHAFGITIQNGGIVTDEEELEARKTRQTNGVFFFLLFTSYKLLSISILLVCLFCPLPGRLVGRHAFQ